MLETLELINIRSYENGLFEFGSGVNIIVGANASGKTNTLEAIYAACQGGSFRGNDAMLRRDADWGRITAYFDGHERICKLQDGKRSFVVDGTDYKRFVPRLSIPVVLFEPNDMLMLAGEPERRRNYIDGLLMQTKLGYRKTIADYKRSLSQRNRLLKQDLPGVEHLFVWDVRLSELGGEIAAARKEIVEKLNAQATSDYRSISGNEESLNLSYDSKIALDNYSSDMLKKLQQSYELDIARGFSGTGPHRDDLRIEMNGVDVRQNASRGESRTVVLALKIFELELISAQQATSPLLLLDDVFSELDGRRRRLLADHLKKYQTFITTTDADVVMSHFAKKATIIPL